MRLIDADYVTGKLNEINGTAELDKAFEAVENAPTVDVLDKIKTEIHEYLCEVGYTGWIDISKNKIEGDIFKIIEKYMG